MAKGLPASAWKPSRVLGQLEEDKVNFVSSLDEIMRGEVAGYNVRDFGGYRQLLPRLSAKDYHALCQANLPEVEGMLQSMVSRVGTMTHEDKLAYLSTRRLVRQMMPDGEERLIIVPRVPAAMTEAEILDIEDASDTEFVQSIVPPSSEQLASRLNKRQYTLGQVMYDTSVRDKYTMPVRSVQTALRLASSDPVMSANLFQAMMNNCQTKVDVRVRAGEYARDRCQAKNSLIQFCRGSPQDELGVQSLLIGDKIFIYGPDGEDGWHVSGPVKYTSEIYYLYWAVKHQGPTLPSWLLSMELVLLEIDIFDGFSSAQPRLQFHAAQEGFDAPSAGLSQRTTSMLTTSDRTMLQGLGEKLVSIYDADGFRQLATGIRVTGKFVLANMHIVDAYPGANVEGAPLVVRSQISRDMCSVKCEGESSPWNLRIPVLGELVFVCYLQQGKVSCSAPVKITSIDSSCLVTTLHDSITHGMSGGAVVAVGDMALLGIHSGQTNNSLIAYRFGDKEFGDLMHSDSATTFSRQDDVGSFAAKVVDHFRRTGTTSIFAAATGSLIPVYVQNQHIGMAVRNGSKLYTACDPDLPLRLGDGAEEQKMVVRFDKYREGAYMADTYDVGSSPIFRRTPEYYEKVFIVGRDDDIFITSQTRVVHVGTGGQTFTLASIPGLDRPVLGGLVMSHDGAVLGCCGSLTMHTATGLGYRCWTLDREPPPDTVDPRVALTSAFPFLNVTAWPDEILEEVFTHSSVNNYKNGRFFNAGMKPLANIGDNAAKALLYVSLQEAEVPHSQWAGYMQSLQSNAKFAEIAWSFNYAHCMVAGKGINMQRTSKAYADLTEALIGAAYKMERPPVVLQLCRAMGVVFNVVLPRVASPFNDDIIENT